MSSDGRSTGGVDQISLLDGWLRELYEDATEAWGEDAQITLAQEELAELSVELARDFRGRNDREDVIDEIADVLIAANQLALIYGLDETEERIEYKLQRLGERIQRSQDTDTDRGGESDAE